MPLLSTKPSPFEVPQRPGQLNFHWKIGSVVLFSTFYTRFDQACLVWGLLSGIIFIAAQFLAIDWLWQAVWWSVLTIIGLAATLAIVPDWVYQDRKGWIIHSWTLLMGTGLILTDLGIIYSWSWILTNLCQLWLIVVALGYVLTGLGLRSRTLIIIGTIHVASIVLLPYVATWQFLFTGIIMSLGSLALAQLQWDCKKSALIRGIEKGQNLWESSHITKVRSLSTPLIKS
ncbi:MAG: hypothetical protein SAJ11_20775 [Jaaginema sp. PMC 1078.18]|nr:hypothetical protein [Jaaginema sp. PMC 1078.18]